MSTPNENTGPVAPVSAVRTVNVVKLGRSHKRYAVHVEGLGYISAARGATKRRPAQFKTGGLDVWLIESPLQAVEWARHVQKVLAQSFLFEAKPPVVSVRIVKVTETSLQTARGGHTS